MPVVVLALEWQLLQINNVSMQQAVTDWWSALSAPARNASVATRLQSYGYSGGEHNFTHTYFDCIWNASNPIPASLTEDQRRCAPPPPFRKVHQVNSWQLQFITASFSHAIARALLDCGRFEPTSQPLSSHTLIQYFARGDFLAAMNARDLSRSMGAPTVPSYVNHYFCNPSCAAFRTWY